MMEATTEQHRRPTAADSKRGTDAHVVTVTHNSGSTLDRFFAGLEANADQVARLTIVDNASSDDTISKITELSRGASFDVVLIRNDNTGFAGGYQAASRDTTAPTSPVLCVNPDVQLAAGTASAMLEVLDSFDDAGIVTAPLIELNGAADSASRRRLPTLGASMVYSILGRFTPTAIRYNARAVAVLTASESHGGVRVTELQATTGALMLVHPQFRSLRTGVFDVDYWMYGEDLQLCVDAAAAGRRVLMAEVAPSLHVKGVSSGRPRSTVSNRAFHVAMLTYARKNLVQHPLALAALRMAIGAHFVLSELRAAPVRRLRHGRRLLAD